MANRQLSSEELANIARPFVDEVRRRLAELSAGDADLHWALRRKLAKELTYDERSKPMERRALKAFKRGQQGNKCAICDGELPERNAVLDRLEAMKGYTRENTRLVCPTCDRVEQERRGFA
jgi:rubrerythrin